MQFNYRKLILACFTAACVASTCQAGRIYTISASTTEGTAITGTATFDTNTHKFTSWDIIAAADPGATRGGFAAGEWDMSNTTVNGENDANGLFLINGPQPNPANFILLAFLTSVTGTAGESVTIWTNVNGGSYRFGSAIEDLGAGCCRTHLSGTLTADAGAATPEPATWGMFAGVGLLALLERKRRALVS